eukprot:scaffold3161_cov146-Amphora_coffeaeformis.AAC.5
MTSLVLASPQKFTHVYRRSFSVTEKKKVLDTLLEDTHGTLSKIARDNSIDRSTLLKWMRQRDEKLKAAEKSSLARRVSGGGRPCLLDKPVATALLDFVEERHSAYQPVTACMLYYQWIKVEPSASALSESAAKARIYRFMRRNDLVIRRTTHHAQVSRNCVCFGMMVRAVGRMPRARQMLRSHAQCCGLMNRRKDGVRNLSVASLGLRKLKGPRRGVGWVVEGYGVGPGDVFAGVWDGGGFELHALQVFDDSVGCGAVSVPDGPPAAGCFWEVLVRGWLAE